MTCILRMMMRKNRKRNSQTNSKHAMKDLLETFRKEFLWIYLMKTMKNGGRGFII